MISIQCYKGEKCKSPDSKGYFTFTVREYSTLFQGDNITAGLSTFFGDGLNPETSRDCYAIRTYFDLERNIRLQLIALLIKHLYEHTPMSKSGKTNIPIVFVQAMVTERTIILPSLERQTLSRQRTNFV